MSETQQSNMSSREYVYIESNGKAELLLYVWYLMFDDANRLKAAAAVILTVRKSLNRLEL